MKNLMIALFLTASALAFGQNEKKKMKMDHEFTTEQMAILKTKKMALALDLSSNQQDQMLTLHKNWIEEKMARKEAHKSLDKADMSSDQKFEMMNQSLDRKMAQQEQIKKILDKDQYEMWKKHSVKMHHKSKGKMAHKETKSHKR
ncbi:hypothetical protein [Lutimonas sp.]|uniref:hypothetical protein n=1 Tax=Lutimonas sp. TaxID=1872403 RepID=UPI003D9B1466